MFFFVLSVLLKCVFVLLSIAFVTLLERKVLSYSQLRVGPDKVGFVGVLQPVLDGVKLLLKEFFLPSKILWWGGLLGPFLGFLVMLFLWSVFPVLVGSNYSFFSMIFVLVFIGLSVYSTLVSGWSSVSKFSFLGAVRSCSQSISYEISLVFLFFSLFLLCSSSIFRLFFSVSGWILLGVFWLSCVAETNRAPFDFSEGESELISGFNLEFGSSPFVLLFLAEYGMILFFSMVLSVVFFSSSFFFFSFWVVSFLFIRSVYPRFRYDKLMNLTWLKFLPFSMSVLMSFLVIFYFY